MATYHSAADVLARVLTDAGLGSTVDSTGTPAGSWPVYATHEPDEPDSCVTIYNTDGYGGVRDFITRKVGGMDGFQVRVRAATHTLAHDKIQAIYDYLSETLYNLGISIDSKYYVVHSCELFGNVIDLGKESPNSQRSIVVFNAQVQINDRTP